jgi:hypothetical protein
MYYIHNAQPLCLLGHETCEIDTATNMAILSDNAGGNTVIEFREIPSAVNKLYYDYTDG